MRIARMVALTLLLAAATSDVVLSQTAAPGGPTFDVVSIKRRLNEDGPATANFEPGGRFVMVNAPITALIGRAYPRTNPRLAGAPDWLGRESYDITATASGNPTPAEMEPMLQALLAERFKLAIHVETEQQESFALIAARKDGRLGPGLRKLEVGVDCAGRAAATRAGQLPPPLAPAKNGLAPCIVRAYDGIVLSGGIPMAHLANSLTFPAGRTVVDKTGLTDQYEVTLNYRPGPISAEDRLGEPPSLFTALQEQLGLKLESIRSVVEVLVIDHIERPTSN